VLPLIIMLLQLHMCPSSVLVELTHRQVQQVELALTAQTTTTALEMARGTPAVLETIAQ